MRNKQVQRAGEGSQQIQTENMIVNVGIDEKRAREIYQEMNTQIRKEYSQEAFEIATSRILEFENKLMPKMEEVDGALQAFADPSFQLLLVEAQKTASSTERSADYDLLSELLIHRFKKGENRVTRAGISRAVEIVDEIADEALLGLTVFHAVTTFVPMSGHILKGLDTLNDLFGKIIYGELPEGNQWLDHLDILDALRINSMGSMKKIKEYYPENLVGYVEVGIKKTSDSYNESIQLLKNNGIPLDILVDHELNSDYVRLNLTGENQINSLNFNQVTVINGNLTVLPRPINSDQIEILKSIYNFYINDDGIKNKNINRLMEEWNKRTNLNKLRNWWDQLSSSIQITSVGKVLAHSNAQRCDKNLPPFN